MKKDLKTRIADILDDHSDWIYRCNCGHEGGYSEHLAQVIIDNLGLQRQEIPEGQPEAHRYTTEWILDA